MRICNWLLPILLLFSGCGEDRANTQASGGGGAPPSIHAGPADILAGWGSYATWAGGGLTVLAILLFAFGARKLAVSAGTAAAGLIAAGIVLFYLGVYFLWIVAGVVLLAGYLLWRGADSIEAAIKRVFGVKIDFNFNGR